MNVKSLVYQVGMAVLLLVLLGGRHAGAKIGVNVTVTSVLGDVKIFKNDQGWMPASPGDSLTLENKIKTGEESRAEIEYDDGTVMRMKSGCELILLENSIRLNFGDTWIQAVKRGNRFKVITPTAVAGVKGTIFEVDVTRDTGDTRVAVYNGIVEVASMNSRILLFSARQTMVRRGQPPEKPAYFDKWRERKTWADNLFKSNRPKPDKRPGKKPEQPETGHLQPKTGHPKQAPPTGGALQWPPVGKIRPEVTEPPPDKLVPSRKPGIIPPGELSREEFDRSTPPDELRERFRDNLGREIRHTPGRSQELPPGQRHEAATVEDLKHEVQPPWKRSDYRERVEPPTAKEGFEPGYRDRTSLELSDRKDLHRPETAFPIPPQPPKPGQFLDSFSKMPRNEQDRILNLMRNERERQLDILLQRINDQGKAVPPGLLPRPENLPGQGNISTQNQLQNLNEQYNTDRAQDQNLPPGPPPGGENRSGVNIP